MNEIKQPSNDITNQEYYTKQPINNVSTSINNLSNPLYTKRRDVKRQQMNEIKQPSNDITNQEYYTKQPINNVSTSINKTNTILKSTGGKRNWKRKSKKKLKNKKISKCGVVTHQ
jgi:hypothetical protein